MCLPAEPPAGEEYPKPEDLNPRGRDRGGTSRQGDTARSGYGEHLNDLLTVTMSRRAEPREVGTVNRASAGWFLVAFAVIGVTTVIEGINDGFTVLNWVVVAVSVVFAGQATWTLARNRG